MKEVKTRKDSVGKAHCFSISSSSSSSLSYVIFASSLSSINEISPISTLLQLYNHKLSLLLLLLLLFALSSHYLSNQMFMIPQRCVLFTWFAQIPYIFFQISLFVSIFWYYLARIDCVITFESRRICYDLLVCSFFFPTLHLFGLLRKFLRSIYLKPELLKKWPLFHLKFQPFYFGVFIYLSTFTRIWVPTVQGLRLVAALVYNIQKTHLRFISFASGYLSSHYSDKSFGVLHYQFCFSL